METVTLSENFTPLPPLPHAPQLKAKSCYKLAVTDWSIIVLKFSSDANNDASVLCELPWLGIKEVSSEAISSSDLYEIAGQKKAKTTNFVTIMPKLDLSNVPVKEQEHLKRSADQFNNAESTASIPSWDRLLGSSYLPGPCPSPLQQPQSASRYTGRGHPSSPAHQKASRSFKQGDRQQARVPGSDPRTQEAERFLFFKPDERYQANPWFQPPPPSVCVPSISTPPPPPSGWMVGPRPLGEGVEDQMSIEEQQHAWTLWQQQQLISGSHSSPSKFVKKANEETLSNKGLYCSADWKSSPVSIEYQRSEAALKRLSAEEQRRLQVKQQTHSTPNLLTWVEEQSIQWQKEQGIQRARDQKKTNFWLPNQGNHAHPLPPDQSYVIRHRPLEPTMQPPHGFTPHDPGQPPPYIIQQSQAHRHQPPSNYTCETPAPQKAGHSYDFPYHEPNRKERLEKEKALETKYAIHHSKTDGPINFSTWIPAGHADASYHDRLPHPDQRQALPPSVLQPSRDERWRHADDDPIDYSAEDMLEEDALPGYAFKFFTIEPHSLIFFHIKKAWLGAHLRLGMTAAGKAGLPFWYLPPPTPFLVQSGKEAVRKACADMSMAIQKDGGLISIPDLRTWDRPLQKISLLSFFGHRIVLTPPSHQHLQRALGSLASVGLMQLFPPSPPFPKLARWPDLPIISVTLGDVRWYSGEPGKTWLNALEQEQERQLEGQQRIYNLEPLSTKFHGGGILERTSLASSDARSPEPGKDETPSARVAAPRDLWRVWSNGDLSRGCSIFEDNDMDLIRRIHSEFAISGPKRAHELASRFFSSPQALAFILHRLYSWGALCSLYCLDSPFCSSKSDPMANGVTAKAYVSPYIEFVMSKGSRSDRVFVQAGRDQRAQRDIDLVHKEVDLITGSYQTHEEHMIEQFVKAQEKKLSQGGPSQGQTPTPTPRPRDILRKLSLLPDAPVSLPRTFSAIADIAKKVSALSAAARSEDSMPLCAARSNPPPVQAPPTLAPSDPLMLSPLSELPYLFILSQAASTLPPSITLAKGPAEQVELERQMRSYQNKSVGAQLKGDFVSNYLGAGHPDPDEISSYRPRAVKNWDRLMGRMVARLAWKKTQMLLSCLNAYLCSSEGAAGREIWLSLSSFTRALSDEGVLMASYKNDPEALAVSGWSWSGCTKSLHLAILQLRDPDVSSNHKTSRARSKTDMLSWCETGRRDCLIDLQSSLLYEIEGLCHQSDVLHTSHRYYSEGHASHLYGRTLQSLDIHFASQLSTRLLDRLLCLLTGTAALHGLPLPFVNPYAVAEIITPGSGAQVTKSEEALIAVQTAACVGSAHTLISEVSAIHCSEVLLHLLSHCPGAAASLGGSYSEELRHLVRTPEVRERLRMRSCNAIIARATLDNLNSCLDLIERLSDDAAITRGAAAGCTSGLSVPHLSTRGVMMKMPGLLT